MSRQSYHNSPQHVPNQEALELAADVLNQALACDPVAIQAIMAVEIPINDTLAKHPTIQVGKSIIKPTDGECVLRPIGLINGLFGGDSEGRGFIYMIVYPDGRIERFGVHSEKREI